MRDALEKKVATANEAHVLAREAEQSALARAEEAQRQLAIIRQLKASEDKNQIDKEKRKVVGIIERCEQIRTITRKRLRLTLDFVLVSVCLAGAFLQYTGDKFRQALMLVAASAILPVRLEVSLRYQVFPAWTKGVVFSRLLVSLRHHAQEMSSIDLLDKWLDVDKIEHKLRLLEIPRDIGS